MTKHRSAPLAGSAPLPPRRKWRAITIATLVLMPAYWMLLIGVVAVAADRDDAPLAAPYIAFGLALIPFVFVVLAFLSEHPRAPAAVVKAMALTLVVGVPVSAIAGDAVTGLVAGVGAGGVSALRADVDHNGRARAIAVVLATAYVFVLVRVASDVALLVGAALPLTSIGIADHLSERRKAKRTVTT
jgi:hypothetical protein